MPVTVVYGQRCDSEQASRLDPKNPYPYLSRCWLFTAKGSYDSAVASCDQGMRLNPQYLELFYNNLCFALVGKGDYDRAIHDCGRAIQLIPEDAFAYINRGDSYRNKGDYGHAITDYNQAIALSPPAASVVASLCSGYFAKGDNERAIPNCIEAPRIDPKHTRPHYGLGLAWQAKGDYGRALASFNDVIRLDPDYAEAHYNRGLVFVAQGDGERAAADFEKAIRLKPDFAGPYSGRAWLLFKTDNVSEAKSDADKGVSLDAADANTRDTRGHILLSLGNAAAALDDLNEALRLRPDSISSLWGRGQAYEQQGLRSLALADYKKAIELKAADPKAIGAQNEARARLIVLEAPAAPAQTAITIQSPKTPMGRRVALVIGNASYKSVGELANPKNDAAAVAGELARLGFEVMEKHDLGVAQMRKALGEFEDKIAGAKWGVVYYAGHGMELDGRNWLIPIDAELLRATDVPDEAIELDRVLARLNAVSKLRVVILDACRNNPFIARMVMNRVSTRAVARGLSAVEPSHGEVVFYAARDGSVASDGTGANSPFATALVKHMDEDGVELGRFFRRVTSTVLAATKNQQEPFVYGRIPDEDFFFKPLR
jgi:tetratricopeptide (TPR) repeat protein